VRGYSVRLHYISYKILITIDFYALVWHKKLIGATDGCPIPFRASRLDLPIPGRFTLVFLLGFQDDKYAGCLYTNAIAQTLAGHPMRFTDTKSETLNLRVSPTFKRVLQEVADHERRSMVNMLEVLLGDYCERKGIIPPDQSATAPAHKRARADRRAQVGATA
jgi:hypothetical protein